MVKPRIWAPGINNKHPLSNGLVGYWPFWEGTGDRVMNVADQTLFGTPTGPNWDWEGQAMALGIVEVANNSRLDVNEVTVSILARNYKGVITTGSEYIFYRSGSGIDSFELVWQQSENLLWFGDVTGGDNWQTNWPLGLDPASGRDPRNWFILTCVRKSGYSAIYYNGEIGAENAADTAGDIADTSHPLIIGGRNAETSYWDGWVGMAAMWNRALSAGEIHEHARGYYDLIKPRNSMAVFSMGAIGEVAVPSSSSSSSVSSSSSSSSSSGYSSSSSSSSSSVSSSSSSVSSSSSSVSSSSSSLSTSSSSSSVSSSSTSSSSSGVVAVFAFENLSPGYEYQVSATWDPDTVGSTEAEYRVVNNVNSDISNLLEAETVDQTVPPDDYVDTEGPWKNIGDPVLIRGRTLTVEVRESDTTNNIQIERIGIWVKPTGIPRPEFSIEQTHWMYAGLNGTGEQYTYDYGAGPEPYKIGSDGPYTHYVDREDPLATDSGNTYGTPSLPRVTIPQTLAAGSVVEVHGDGYLGAAGKNSVYANGTAELPVFLRGTSDMELPRLDRVLNIGYYNPSYYLIVENLDLVSATCRNDAHHIIIRTCTCRDGGGVSIYCTESTDYIYDIIFYNNIIYDNGDWQSVDENDIHAVTVNSYARRVWVIDNEMYHNGGDSIQVNGMDDDLSSDEFIYVARNTMHHEGENAIDIKECQDVVCSENETYAFGRAYKPRPGATNVIHYNPERVWFINNSIHDGENGIETTESTNFYVIGNEIYNMSHGDVVVDPDSVYTIGVGFHARNSINTYFINNTISNCDVGLTAGFNNGINLINNIVAEITDGNYHINFEGSTASTSDMEYNLLDPHSDSTIRMLWSGVYASIVDFQNATGKGEGCIEGDPEFVDLVNNDFDLKDGSIISPAINAGAPSGTGNGSLQEYIDLYFYLYGEDISVGINGVTRPQGSRVDMGAYEAIDGDSA